MPERAPPGREKDLARALARRRPHLPLLLSERMTRRIFAAIKRALRNGGRVEIRGFGAFFLRERKARFLRDPRNGAVVEIPPTRIPRFRAARGLARRVADGGE